MLQKNGGAILAIAVVLAAGGAKAAAYFENGFFKRPQPPSGSMAVMDVGERYGGWRVVGAAGTVSWIQTNYTHRGFQFVAPPKSSTWVNLAGTSATATGITHSPVPTVPGQTYTLTFSVGNLVDPAGIYGSSSTVLVYENDRLIGKVTNSGGAGTTTENWLATQLNFTADKDWTVISFINGDPPGDLNCGIGDINMAKAGETADTDALEGAP